MSDDSDESAFSFARALAAYVVIALIAAHGVYTPWRLASEQDPVSELRARGQREAAHLRSLEVIGIEVAAGRGEIGYLTDDPVDPADPGPTEARYYLTQFALAPLLIRRDPDPDLTLADFRNPRKFELALRARDLEVVRRLGPGRALVRARQR